MPNYCENNIYISAKTPNDLLKFVRKYLLEKGGSNGSLELDFNRIVHEPRSINECPPQYINNNSNNIQKLKGRNWFNWYDWRCAYWGTKWNVNNKDSCFFSIDSIDEILTHNINNISIYAQTAWSPPIPLLQEWQRQAQAMDPDILIEADYYEPGWGFAGELHSDGSDIDVPFDSMDDDFRKWTIHNGYESVEHYMDLDADEDIVHDADYYEDLENYE